MTWRAAYLAQAVSDYAVFREFMGRGDVKYCHKLHYLQMATEKLAKAFLSPVAGGAPPRVHTAVVRFLQITKGRPEIRRRLGYESNYHAYCSYVDSLLDVAQRVESLAPVSAREAPNPEYPWEGPDGEVIPPVTYVFPEFGRQEIIEFQKLIDGLFRIFAPS